MTITYAWREPFADEEVNALHAEAFGHSVDMVEWSRITAQHSMGWVTARDRDLVGFANVIWDGHAHAWIQDVMVAERVRRRRVGTRMITVARHEAAGAGCEWLHVDFEEELAPFYFEACGFEPTAAGLIRLD